MTQKIDAALPVSVHEAFILKFRRRRPGTTELESDDTLQRLADAMANARAAAKKIHASHAAIMANRLNTFLANARQSRRVSFKLLEDASKKLDAARAFALAEVARLEQLTKAPPAPKDIGSVMIATETRNALAQMSQDQRARALADAELANDESLIGAVLNGPAILSGMSPAEQNVARGSWQRQRFPHELDRIQRISKAIQATDRGGASLVTWVAALTPGAELERAEVLEREAKAIGVA